MGNFIGIDLGTTFSVVAHVETSGRPVIIPDNSQNGEHRITPSVVAFVEGGSDLVGFEAKTTLGIDKNTFGHFKRDMGKEKTHVVNGERQTATTLSAKVLEKLRKIAEDKLGSVDGAVVTVPANFAEEARQATMAAAKMAGLNIKHIINEPTAAALYYAYESGEDLAGKYAVYDLGGGTFDVTIIEVANRDVEVLATDGVARLGGDDFDEAIRKLVATKYKSETGGDLDPDDYTKTRAEDDKITLSSREKCTIRVRGDKGKAQFDLTRIEFEEAISAKVEEARIVCETAMEEAGVEANDLKGVFLAGGSTRTPLVAQSVKRVFRQDPLGKGNVDEIVALGAALYAIHKAPPEELEVMQQATASAMSVAEIATHCFGTISVGRHAETGEGTLFNSILIPKGKKIPCSVTEDFVTTHDGQESVNCRITQSKGKETDPRWVSTIWTGELAVPGGRPAGQTIQVTFKYDESGMMHCSFLDVASGKKTDVSLAVTSATKTPSEGIDKFTVE